MGLGPVLLLVEDGPHAEIMFCGTESIFNLGKLDVSIPQDFRIGFVAVGAQDIAAAGVPCPRVALFIFLYTDSKPVIALGDDYGEEGGCTTVSFQKPPDLPLHLVFIVERTVFRPLGEFRELLFQPGDKAVEDGVFFSFPSEGTAEHKGFTGAFRGRTEPDLNTGGCLFPGLIQKVLFELLQQ